MKMRINDKEVKLRQVCEGRTECDISDFERLIKAISFYGDDKGYRKWCNLDTKQAYQSNTI